MQVLDVRAGGGGAGSGHPSAWAEGPITGEQRLLHHPLVGVVVDGVVLEAAVVPERQIVLTPVPANHEGGVLDVLEE